MVFVFRKILLVVEVTLTGSSRQEAAEGEPVRRHVAAYETQAAGKRLYGLFLAPSIDSNTANTFRLGEWYKADDSLLTVDIVPLTLDDFIRLLECGMKEPQKLHDGLHTLLLECRARANAPAPRWKSEIRTVVENTCKDLSG